MGRRRDNRMVAIFILLMVIVYFILIGVAYYPLQTIPPLVIFLAIFIFILVKSRRVREFFKNFFQKKQIYSHPPQSLKEAVLRHAHYKCQNCDLKGRHVKLEVHHIVPISKGGTNHFRNLVVLCPNCHSKIPAK